MKTLYHTKEKTPPCNFIIAELRGGPHDGQTLNVPSDQTAVELVEAGKRHQYERTGPRAVFYHRDELARMFGGRRR